ncbi:hypothetical protein [Escherichia coli]|nr:hypothetical protein [Escherichia coli]
MPLHKEEKIIPLENGVPSGVFAYLVYSMLSHSKCTEGLGAS